MLVSGRGSNLEALLAAIESGQVNGAQVVVVVSNRAGVRGLEVAKAHGVPSEVVLGGDLDKSAYDCKLLETLRVHGVERGTGLVLLAGFMRLLSPEFVSAFDGRLLNIHPSLLPSFPGLNSQEQALRYGVKVAGCTVHFVIPAVDAGPIVLQRAVEVKEGDTVETLSERILEQEHLLYPLAVKLFVEGKLDIEGRKVTIKA